MPDATKSPMWEVIPDKTKDHWLELKDPEGWYSAVVRFDGCIHFYRHLNTPIGIGIEDRDKRMDCYLHICDIDAEIRRLQALKEEALKHFGPDWSV